MFPELLQLLSHLVDAVEACVAGNQEAGRQALDKAHDAYNQVAVLTGAQPPRRHGTG